MICAVTVYGLFALALDSVIAQEEFRLEISESTLGVTPQPSGNLCQPVPNDHPWPDDPFADAPINKGLGWQMSQYDMPSAVIIGNLTYQVDANTPMVATFHLAYHPGNEGEVTLRYFVILDEQQIPAFEEKPFLYRDVTLQPGDQATLDLQIPPLEEGIHDLIVFGVVESALDNGGIVHYFTDRRTLVVGDAPAMPVLDYQVLVADATKSGDENFFNLSLHSDRSMHVWVWPEVYKPVDDTLEFFAGVGYMESVNRLAALGITPQASPFALLAFLDSQQIALSEQGPVFYGLLSPNILYSFIPFSIPIAHDPGLSDLLVFRVDYPRVPMCWLWEGINNGYMFDFKGYISRVGVEFK